MKFPFKKRVVIIEDDNILLDSFTHIVNSGERFMAVGSYTTAEEALADIARKKAEIVLMDIELPGMNGVEATAIIKRSIHTLK